jgi:hypothetical protein
MLEKREEASERERRERRPLSHHFIPFKYVFIGVQETLK